MEVHTKERLINLETAGPLAGRSAVFLGCFIIASGILGPRIIAGGLAESFGFQIYGGAGKALLFGALAVAILVWRKGNFPQLKRRATGDWWYLAGAVLAVLAGWLAVGKLIDHAPGAIWPVVVHASILATVMLLVLSSFGLSNFGVIYRTYKAQLWLGLGMAVGYLAFLDLVYGAWVWLAGLVLGSVKGMLHITGIQAAFMPPRTLLFDRFGVTIAQFCSGIDSISLFTALYALVGVLDWNRLDHRRYLAAFVPGLVVLVGFNILRVYGLILGGYYVNPQLAFSLFHTYAGMLFFIVYSGLFWSVAYRWMLAGQTPGKAVTTG